MSHRSPVPIPTPPPALSSPALTFAIHAENFLSGWTFTIERKMGETNCCAGEAGVATSPSTQPPAAPRRRLTRAYARRASPRPPGQKSNQKKKKKKKVRNRGTTPRHGRRAGANAVPGKVCACCWSLFLPPDHADMSPGWGINIKCDRYHRPPGRGGRRWAAGGGGVAHSLSGIIGPRDRVSTRHRT